MTTAVTIQRPDDWHVHFRQPQSLQWTVPHTARVFSHVLAMPNTRPSITTAKQGQEYIERIMNTYRLLLAVHGDDGFNTAFSPHVALYLTPQTTVADVDEAADNPAILGYKLYPAGATTNSDQGITASNIHEMYPVLEAMADNGLHLMIHGEIPGEDMYDREYFFIERILSPLVNHVSSALRITFEHVSTSAGVHFVQRHGNVAATVTAHHLLENRNALFGEGTGLSPHHYCLPVLKTEEDRKILLLAAINHPRFFLGTDSAPHRVAKKECDCASAGCFTAPVAMEMYAEAFHQVSALQSLEAFASLRGAKWYAVDGIKDAEDTITVERFDASEEEKVSANHSFGYDDGEQHGEVICPWSALANRWRIK